MIKLWIAKQFFRLGWWIIRKGYDVRQSKSGKVYLHKKMFREYDKRQARA